jgi:membrane-bound lytic murein transglycosylase B
VAASPPSSTEQTGPATDPLSALVTSPRRRGPGRGAVLVGLCLLAVAAIVVVVIDRHDGPSQPVKPKFTVAQLTPRAGAVVPTKAAAAPAKAAEWSARIAGRTDIPARALLAYAGAELKVRASDPGCRLSWATLAGLGRVESSHGEYGGSEVLDDGTLSVPIIGVPLDGSDGVKAIKDTDNGVLDGDPIWDRAVGAMQFVPTTWRRWAVRANGDGRAPTRRTSTTPRWRPPGTSATPVATCPRRRAGGRAC